MLPLWPISSGFLLAVVVAAGPLAAAPPDTAPAVVDHKVTRGETLWSISQKHHTSVGAIMDYNHLPDHTVREGMLLRIPPNVRESTPSHRHHVHVVRRGEDFWDIADHYDIKPSALAKANPNVNPNRLHQDMELIIPVEEQGDVSTRREDPAPRPQAAAMAQHTVGENDTYYSIGRKYGVPMEAVVAANPNLPPEKLRAGMKVSVPSKNPPPPAAPSNAKSKPGDTATAARGRTHKVKDDESIASIARKYGVSESAILRENKLKEDDPIYVDDILKIPGGSPAVASSQSPQSKPPSAPPKQKTVVSLDKPPANSQPVNSPPNTVGSDGAIRSYIVSAGENENTICEAFGISKQTLFDYNRLAATTKLKPGDEIAIPRVSKGRKR